MEGEVVQSAIIYGVPLSVLVLIIFIVFLLAFFARQHFFPKSSSSPKVPWSFELHRIVEHPILNLMSKLHRKFYVGKDLGSEVINIVKEKFGSSSPFFNLLALFLGLASGCQILEFSVSPRMLASPCLFLLSLMIAWALILLFVFSLGPILFGLATMILDFMLD